MKPSSTKIDYDTTLYSSSAACTDVDYDFNATNIGNRNSHYNYDIYFHNGYDVYRFYTCSLHHFSLDVLQGYARLANYSTIEYFLIVAI